MKEYKNNQELLEHLISKGVIVENEQEALAKFEKYTYYSIVNTYKEVFKDNAKYLDGVTFDEIYSLYEFDKNLKSIFLKYALEIELVIKALIANTIAEKYGVKNYLNRQSFDMNADTNSVKKLVYKLSKYVDTSMSEYATNTKTKVGLLRLGEIMAGQLNMFENNSYYWTITPYVVPVNVRLLHSQGYANSSYPPTTAFGIKPSMNLKSNVIITSGDGTKENPFEIALQ